MTAYLSNCATLRVLEPAPGVLAFYDGRVAGQRAYSAAPNWIDDGAYSLGIASYAILDGANALVFDTHISVPHARAIRSLLEARGARNFTVVLSHWHLDHIAGTEAFGDCEIIAHTWTAEEMGRRREAIEAGREDGQPPINPLVLPTRTYEDELDLVTGNTAIQLRHADIHSRDQTLLIVPSKGVLLAADAVEDTVTFIDEPLRLATHLAGLAQMKNLGDLRILPNHGDPDIIAAGGYPDTLISATEAYVERLLRTSETAQTSTDGDLARFVAPEIEKGWIRYYAPYEEVHRHNLAVVRASRRPSEA